MNHRASVNTEGPLSVVLDDGWCVCGDGMYIPVENQDEGIELVRDLRHIDDEEER